VDADSPKDPCGSSGAIPASVGTPALGLVSPLWFDMALPLPLFFFFFHAFPFPFCLPFIAARQQALIPGQPISRMYGPKTINPLVTCLYSGSSLVTLAGEACLRKTALRPKDTPLGSSRVWCVILNIGAFVGCMRPPFLVTPPLL